MFSANPKKEFQFFRYIYFVVCKCFQFGPVYKFVIWFSLNIYFTSIEKQGLTTYTNLSLFCFLGTTPVPAPNVWANEKIQKLRLAPGTRTRELMIARLTLYLMTTDTTQSLSFNSMENLMGKGENAGYQKMLVTSIFSFSHKVLKT